MARAKCLLAIKPRSKTIVIFSKRLVCCAICGAFKNTPIDRHHVVYKPAKLVILCRSCHFRITRLNTRAAKLLGYKKLSRQYRFCLWYAFVSAEKRCVNLTLVDIQKLLGV